MALEITDRGGSTMCEEHRPLAYMSAVLCVAPPTQITGQGAETEARKERVLVKNIGFNILWSCGASSLFHGSFW